jgi:hypothetical protein
MDTNTQNTQQHNATNTNVKYFKLPAISELSFVRGGEENDLEKK